jgi:ribosomal protein S18 acetylase RimI-like enzyme
LEAFIIRDYISTDFTQVEILWHKTGLGNKERGDDAQIIEQSLKLGGVFYVIETENTKQIIGTSWITNDGRRLYLHHFGIKPEFQKKGLSKFLLNKSLQFAKHKNMQIKLEVHEQNKIAINLYEKAGFKKLGNYKVYIIRDFDKLE